MTISSEQIKSVESKFKGEVFEVIDMLSSKQANIILNVENLADRAKTNNKIPNILITMNNKLIELSHEFKRARISLFSQKVEIGRELIASPSFIGQAIIIDMIKEATYAVELLGKYAESFEEMTKNKLGKGKKIESAKPGKRILLKIASWINLFNKSVSYTKQDREELNGYLSEYNEIDEQLWNYNLRDNIIPSLIAYIKELKYDENRARQMVQTCIIPDLQKLGLGDLISKLEEELKATFKKEDAKSWILETGEKQAIQAGQAKTGKGYCRGIVEKGETITTNTDEYSEQEQI